MDLDELKNDYVKIQMAFEEDMNLSIRKKGVAILDQAGIFIQRLFLKPI